MQKAVWKEILEKVPPEYHNTLLVVTSVGLEVSLQTILRKEEDYLVVRGRLAGTTDTGRVFFIPYDQINLVCVQKPMRLNEVRAMYGEPPEAIDERGEDAPPAEEPAAEEDVEKTRPIMQPPPAEEPPRSSEPPRLNKAELLARIRSRSQPGTRLRPPLEQ